MRNFFEASLLYKQDVLTFYYEIFSRSTMKHIMDHRIILQKQCGLIININVDFIRQAVVHNFKWFS